MTEEIKIQKPKVRLKFIDMARSIAILLMLEGHFVDDSLALVYRDPDNPVFATWSYIRGFTAAVFLTVTGLIFVYLLLKNRAVPYFKNIRVKKGYKRVVELLFWGFVVQYYAFHVLECIAIGILTILVIYGLYKIIRFIPLWIYFFVAGFTIFSLYLYFRDLPSGQPWPEGAWRYIQNAFHGPKNRTIFPVVPWVAYTMFGAMLGALIHDFHDHVKKWYFAGTTFLIGALIYWFPKDILRGVDSIAALITGKHQMHFVYLDWLYIKLGMVLMILSSLMTIDRLLGDRIKDTSLFLKVGQNTLTIYVLHMMVLYGSVIGIGINDYCHKKLGPWEVTIGAILFIATFVLLVKYLDWIRLKLSFILIPIRKLFNKIFFVS